MSDSKEERRDVGERSEAHQDGLSNCLTGLGIDGGDEDTLDTRQRTQRTYTNYHFRSVDEFEAEFEQSWMANVEVSTIPYAMFSQRFDIINVEPEDVDMAAVRSYIATDVSAKQDGSLHRDHGINWYAWQLREQGDKVGGAALFAIVDDGLDPVEPLDVRRIQRVRGWEVFDRSEITPWAVGYNVEPEYYVLADVLAAPTISRGVGPSGQPLEQQKSTLRPGDVIHKSRLWIHHGRRLSRRQMRYRQWWGASVLELNERERRGVEESSEYLRTYADRASWLWLSLAELNELLEREDGEEKLLKRMKVIRRYARTLGIVPTDGGRGKYMEEADVEVPERKPDQLKSVTESTGDLTKIAEWDLHQWARGTGLTASDALNEMPGGLGQGDNKGDRQKKQARVRAEQTLWATPVVNWMLTILFCSREGPTGGLLPTWDLQWPPLYIPTPMEQADLDKKRAEADEVRIRSNTIEANEVTQQRFVEGDQHGPLRVVREEEEQTSVEAGIGPALVGIATQVLAGAIAVGEGRIPPSFYALYLTSIDDARFPPDRAMEIAMSIAANPLPAADVPTEDATEGQQPEHDPLASLFAGIEPNDLRPAREIANELTRRSGLSISTRAITDLIKRHGLRSRRVANKSGFSLREVAEVLGGAESGALDQHADAAADRESPMIIGLRVLSDLAAAVSKRSR